MVNLSRDADCNYSPNREKQSHNYVVSFRILLRCHRSCNCNCNSWSVLASEGGWMGCKMMTRLSPQLICRANAQSDINAACPTVEICRRGLHASRPNEILVCAPAGDPGLMVNPFRDADCNYSPNREKQSHNYDVSFRILLRCHRSCNCNCDSWSVLVSEGVGWGAK
ncbi:hypothetical protein CDAR_120131 [Caerostris darwini]|uniref:Uncharacterized protein n=1 Tax=Caerostris darwini TaxID=1538125 RepID=A0AAV4UPT5_9ARAC|nr:hypothetical protein CDAR_120131 [Caerostris darwini]